MLSLGFCIFNFYPYSSKIEREREREREKEREKRLKKKTYGFFWIARYYVFAYLTKTNIEIRLIMNENKTNQTVYTFAFYLLSYFWITVLLRGCTGASEQNWIDENKCFYVHVRIVIYACRTYERSNEARGVWWPLVLWTLKDQLGLKYHKNSWKSRTIRKANIWKTTVRGVDVGEREVIFVHYLRMRERERGSNLRRQRLASPTDQVLVAQTTWPVPKNWLRDELLGIRYDWHGRLGVVKSEKQGKETSGRGSQDEPAQDKKENGRRTNSAKR